MARVGRILGAISTNDLYYSTRVCDDAKSFEALWWEVQCPRVRRLGCLWQSFWLPAWLTFSFILFAFINQLTCSASTCRSASKDILVAPTTALIAQVQLRLERNQKSTGFSTAQPIDGSGQ
jgi:hypothetical protein